MNTKHSEGSKNGSASDSISLPQQIGDIGKPANQCTDDLITYTLDYEAKVYVNHTGANGPHWKIALDKNGWHSMEVDIPQAMAIRLALEKWEKRQGLR